VPEDPAKKFENALLPVLPALLPPETKLPWGAPETSELLPPNPDPPAPFAMPPPEPNLG